jgi:hypothetical protein
MPPVAPGAGPGSSAPTTGGFVMPTQTPVAQSSAAPAAGGFVMPSLGGQPVVGATAPEARTASATTSGQSTVAPAGAYTPGSTSNAKSYPTTPAGGTGDTGTFYR